jgi:hypothetical protein
MVVGMTAPIQLLLYKWYVLPFFVFICVYVFVLFVFLLVLIS